MLDADCPELVLSLSAEEAQELCNFLVLLPETLPTDCSIEACLQVRRESPPADGPSEAQPVTTWSSMRSNSAIVTIVGSSRKIRVKQYLPDYCFCGHTHYALAPVNANYKPKHGRDLPGPRTSFQVEDRTVGHLGIDYGGYSCATLFICGTLVEGRVVEGSFQDDELIAVMRSLRPGVSEAAAACFARPFASACYWGRHPTAAHAFSTTGALFDGILWNVGIPTVAVPAWRPADATRLAGELLQPISIDGFRLDSVAVFGDGSNPAEIMALYYPGSQNKDSYFLVRHLRSVGLNQTSVPWPPLPGHYPCEIGLEQLEILDRKVFMAHVERSCGAHDALFPTPNLPSGWFTLLQASPSPSLGCEAFRILVESILLNLTIV